MTTSVLLGLQCRPIIKKERTPKAVSPLKVGKCNMFRKNDGNKFYENVLTIVIPVHNGN